MEKKKRYMRESIISGKPNNLLPFDGEAFYYPSFFPRKMSDDFFSSLSKEIAWKQEPIVIFGRAIMQPRLTAWYGDEGKEYSYSGITMKPNPWTSSLLNIKEKIEQISQAPFNSALLNQYRDGQDSVGWHRDNEKELGINPVIGSVSFGATREFQFRHCVDKTLKVSIELEHGSFLLMSGSTQHRWFHSIPKRNAAVDPRINITFRIVK